MASTLNRLLFCCGFSWTSGEIATLFGFESVVLAILQIGDGPIAPVPTFHPCHAVRFGCWRMTLDTLVAWRTLCQPTRCLTMAYVGHTAVGKRETISSTLQESQVPPLLALFKPTKFFSILSYAPRRSLPARQWCNTAPRIPMASTNAVNQAIPHVRRNSLDQENQEAHPKNTHTHNVSYVSHSSFHRHTHNEVILQFIDMPFPPFGCRPGMSQRICCATACSVPIQDGPLGPCGLVGTMR